MSYAATLGAQVGNDLMQVGTNALNSFVQGHINEYFVDRARPKNFEWSQKEAKAADERQRAQYKDLFSPQAMMSQYAAAGLSPSMMMSGGASAVGGTPSGNMTSGAMGPYPSANANPLNHLAAAQIRNLNADSEGKETDNAVKSMEKELKELKYILEKGEIGMMGTRYLDKDTGKMLSLWDYALKHEKFEDFLKDVQKQDYSSIPEVSEYIATTKGRETLQTMFKKSKQLETEMEQLGNDKAYAEVFKKYYKKLSELDYASLSAQQVVQDLKAITEQSKLEESKKKTLNDMIDKIENENVRAIAILLMMFGDRFLGKVNGSISGSTSTSTVYKGE